MEHPRAAGQRKLLVCRSHDQHLFQRRDAIPRAVQGYHAQRPHPLANGNFAHLAGIGAGDDQLTDFIRDRHCFDNGHAAGIPGIFAAIAPAPAIEGDAIEDARVDIQVMERLGRIDDRFLALGADAAHQPLGAGKNDGGGNKERCDAHIVEARNRARRVIAVHRA